MSPSRRYLSRASLLACALAAAACGDRGPVNVTQPAAAPAPTPVLVASVRCTADVRSHAVSCARGDLPATARGYIIVGGQHQFVDVTSSNVTYDGTSAFGFDITVKNLIAQAMATTDGVSPDANGVRVFFATGPSVTGGTGNASVGNADGTNTFTATNQPYFQYAGTDLGGDGILSSNETSGAKHWVLNIDNTVTTFAFTLFVATEVQFPNGYIQVTPGTQKIFAGDSVTMLDSVRTAVGTPVTATTTWASSDPSIATVDAAGKVIGVMPGTVTITATSGLRSGTASISVCPNLAVGAAYTASMPAASSLCLGGGASGAEFVYIPVNLSQTTSLSGMGVTASGVVAISGPPTPDRLAPGGLRLGMVPAGPELGSDLPILERGRADVARFFGDSRHLIQRGARPARSGGRYVITPNVVPSVGDSMDLNTALSCNTGSSVRRGVVRSVKQHIIIVSDTANPAGGFTTAQYDSIALEFDTLAWPVDSANFGPPTDLDGNGRVVAFFTRAVNELSPPASSVVTLGYWISKDMYNSAPASCPNSNEGEMFYMLVPDPTGVVNSNVRTVSFVRGNTTGTLGHEFQHLINGFRRTYDPGGQQPLEEGFLNEGLSHVAEELMFYRASVGLAPRGNIVVTQLTTGPLASRRVAAFNAYANPNYGRLKGWLNRPDTTGAFRQNQNSLAVRGAIWAFLRYASDRVNGSEPAFWYSLVNSGLTGKTNIQSAIGGADPDLWLRDFTAAMYMDDSGVAGVASQYTQPSWSFRSIFIALNGSYQLVPRTLSNNTPLNLSYGPGGGTMYGRFGVSASSFATVTTSSQPSSPYALIVMRTK